MSTDAQPAESSPAADPSAPLTALDQAVASNDVTAYREAKRAERAGTPLKPPPAESAPAPSGDQTTSTEVTPEAASEAAKPRPNAETRVKELLAERARYREETESLKRRLADLERQSPSASREDKTPAPPPVQAATFPTYDEYLKTNPDASYEQYLDDRSDFRVARALEAKDAESRQRAERERLTQSVQERDAKFRAQLDQASTADPEFLEKCSPEVLALRPFSAIRDEAGRWTEQPTGYHAVADEILASSVAPQLMRHFSDHPDDLHRVAKLSPRDLLREMGKLEARFSDGEKPARVAPKTVTNAPPPPTTLGTRPASPADPVDAAVATGDVSAYRAARLRERTANMR